jgi:S1-C subfamily serine protease
VVIVVLVIALVTGFTGAFLWARSDSNQLRRSTPPTPTLDRSRADQAPSGQDEPTSTTRPDLSVEALTKKESPSVLTVSTLNSAGQPVEGTAFVAATPGGQTLLLTSLSVVEASTRQPAPDITLKGDRYNGPATLWTWDPGHDLALLVVGRTGAPALPWAADTGAAKVGDKLFAVAAGGQVRPGVVTALSDAAVQHNVFVDDHVRGAPLVNVKGEVLGVASAAYTAGGAPTDTSFFGVPLAAACAVVLHCGGGSTSASTVPPSGPTASTTPTKPTTSTKSAPSTTRRP